jgi:hypothetical protein
MRIQIQLVLLAVLLTVCQGASSQGGNSGWGIIADEKPLIRTTKGDSSAQGPLPDFWENVVVKKAGEPHFEEFSNGIWFRIEVGVPGSPHQTLGDDDIDALLIIREYIPDLDRYQLKELEFFTARLSPKPPPLSKGHSRWKQNLSALPLFGVDIDRFRSGEAAISGLLIDPDSPEVQSENWLSEASAMELALAELEQYGPTESISVGDINIEAYTDVDARRIVISPVLRVNSQEAMVQVDLYSREVSSHKLEAFHAG